jgi:hypothetical protein
MRYYKIILSIFYFIRQTTHNKNHSQKLFPKIIPKNHSQKPISKKEGSKGNYVPF